MSTTTIDFGSQLERLMNDRRVRIGGLFAGAVIIATSVIVANVSNNPSPRSKSVAVLPDSPVNVPIMRQWPYSDARKVAVVSVRAPGAKVTKANKRGVLTARR